VARFILVTEKSLGIPAIRLKPLASAFWKIAQISGFPAKLATSLCQPRLFHIDENSPLESRAPDSQNEVSGGESAPGG
jgi:hypothetical protein